MRAIPLRLIPAHVVSQLLDYPSCVEVLRAVMPKVSAGKALLPLRHGLPLPDGKGVLGMMPGALDGEPGWFGIKLVSLFPGNTARGLSSHLGLYALYEAETGQPLALLEAGGLTAIRTAAASVVATQALARDDARTLLVVGAGEQAEHHLRAFAGRCVPSKPSGYGRGGSRLHGSLPIGWRRIPCVKSRYLNPLMLQWKVQMSSVR